MYPPVDTDTLVATDDWRRDLTDDEQRQLDALPAQFLLARRGWSTTSASTA